MENRDQSELCVPTTSFTLLTAKLERHLYTLQSGPVDKLASYFKVEDSL